MRQLSLADAMREAMIQEMRRDASVILMGEDVGRFNGAFHVSHGMLDEFGPTRVWDTPISEAGFMGMGIGAALTGLRPIIEFQYADFMFCAMDQIVNEAAKLRLMSGGQASVPLVMRAPQGATGRAAQHSQSVEAYFMHTPGLYLGMPATPYDAKGMMITAIRSNDPVMLLEHKLLYGAASPGGGKALTDKTISDIGSDVPEEAYEISLGKADVKREGSDVTIIATLIMLHRALAVAAELEKEGISCEVIDPRWIVPLDEETILGSVEKTNRVVVASEDVARGGVGAELAALISRKAFDYLDAPVNCVSADNSPIPFGPAAESHVVPQIDDIRQAVYEVIKD
ncbi:MAG: acetoin:2,6-dichlorophenolindophenol oxidoreductase subunit beta [Chloroflexota bacterium]|nr:acetoin:2,6-dichlorophenolindophenol oxidoreductase subunit beta [Chloroflexota bacterium]